MRGWLLVAGVACGGVAPSDDVGLSDTDAPLPDAVTWHAHVRPIAERSCVGCHDDGGIGPFSMADPGAPWGATPSWAAAAVVAVRSRTMPPWHASDDCHPIEGSLALSEREIALWDRWADQGYAEGDRAAYAAPDLPESIDLGAPDLVLEPAAAYTPSRARPDDYRCIPLGDALAEQVDLRAIRIEPGSRAIVHHAILYLVPPESAEAVVAADAADPGLGYACFGGPLPGLGGSAENTFAYVPGLEQDVLPEGDARRWPAGSRLVMQMHYNVLGVAADEPVPSDATTVSAWRYEGTPTGIVVTTPLPHTGIVIAAGDPESVQTKSFSFGAEAEVVGAIGHMHTLGRSLRLDAVGSGGTRCALDIPTWDFNWQRLYHFPVDDPFLLGRDDQVVLTCTYDNSAANQPVVDGEAIEPRTVRWGEGTLDEMCLAYALVRVPTAITGDGDCGVFEDCFRSCPSNDGPCLARCLARATDTCGVCGITQLGACAVSACGLEFLPLGACLDSCPDGPLRCLRESCRSETEAYLSCIGDDVLAGTCDPYLGTCGISFGAGGP